jgi:hypothetical protein
MACCCQVTCGCNMSISAFVPTTASGSQYAGKILSRAESCNCHILNYPYHFIGTLCTSSGIVVSIVYTDGFIVTGTMRSAPLTIDTAGPCGTTSYTTTCVDSLGPGRQNCGTLGWPTTTSTLTLSDFTYYSGSPYNDFFNNYFPNWIKVMPSSNPLP